MIGCAAVLAIVPLLVGAIGALSMTDAPLAGRLTVAVMPAAMVFMAVLLLALRDNARHRRHMKSVRKMLLDRRPVDDAEFCSHFPGSDPELLTLTRDGVARFFDVPSACIHPTDQLDSDFHFSSLEPAFHTCVVYHVLAECGAIDAPFTFRSHRVSDVATLSKEISHILKRLPNLSDVPTDDE
ncbi:hypothetical protein Poly21_29030 [Allorhodopirellula heiligendammensis]|uniref:Uncharacterized protein n=2 Tax=Allorhodopirellula heiligendammensis TaxID=2714739 RepID=A0A5C6BWQ8_9BACT|nr:hypothetical protein Poly21_29030 [Allorhodopirellula heiligendammensis]